MKNILFGCIVILFVSNVLAAEVSWDKVLASNGGLRVLWSKQTPYQKAEFLELCFKSINYCQVHIGQKVSGLDLSVTGPRVASFSQITDETLSMLYADYGDLKKSAEFSRRFWEEVARNPDTPMLSAEENALDNVITTYEKAGMYKEVLQYYEKRHQDYINTMKTFSDIGLFKKNFTEYKKKYPDLAEDYSVFMQSWHEAKRLAKVAKLKTLESAVQNHEWFYSDKPDEVMKALEYYHTNKVGFMVEKALTHKDPKVAAKAKEYLEDLKNTGTK